MGKCKCQRCEYEWESEVEKPVKCARCRSLLWNQERKYRLKARPEVVPTEPRKPARITPDKLYGVTQQDLMEVLREFDAEYRVYEKELRALKQIVKKAFQK